MSDTVENKTEVNFNAPVNADQVTGAGDINVDQSTEVVTHGDVGSVETGQQVKAENIHGGVNFDGVTYQGDANAYTFMLPLLESEKAKKEYVKLAKAISEDALPTAVEADLKSQARALSDLAYSIDQGNEGVTALDLKTHADEMASIAPNTGKYALGKLYEVSVGVLKDALKLYELSPF